MSESYSETSKFEYERGSKNTSSNLIRSNTKLREYARMSTFRSDSSNNSKKFKFRNKVGRRDVLVQTDKKMFDKFLKHKCNELLKKRKGRERNKLVQTEEEVSEAEEQRQKELLLQYGHKFSRAGDSSFRGFSSGENNEIVYKNPQRASLQLFPLTIQEESDMFEVTGTPARRESNAKDSFRYPLKSLRKPRESQFKKQKAEKFYDDGISSDSKKKKKANVKKKMSSIQIDAYLPPPKRTPNLASQRRKTRMLSKGNSQQVSFFSRGLDSSRGNNSSEGERKSKMSQFRGESQDG
mmetsp:Transcript_19553/g.19222  ORF Transcript_19553/g.19222 Transcript_19553/m.19222 type:complete len:295 (-) Transcript_19553:15-899(-)